MPRTVSTAYGFQDVTAVINGKEVFGFWEGDDAVVVEESEDIGSLLIGADGSGVFSQFSGRGARITLRLQHGSPTHRYCTQLLAQQRSGNIDGLPFSVRDRRSNEGGQSDAVFIVQAPSMSSGKAATVREWVFATADFQHNVPFQT